MGTPTVPSYKVPLAVLVENSFNLKFASSLVCRGGVFPNVLKCIKVFSIIRVIYQGGPKEDLDQEHGFRKVSGVSWIIASALVLLRQELRPVLEKSLGE